MEDITKIKITKLNFNNFFFFYLKTLRRNQNEMPNAFIYRRYYTNITYFFNLKRVDYT